VTRFVRCKQCNVIVADDRCAFALHTRTTAGEKYIFCCEKCAEHYEKKKRN